MVAETQTRSSAEFVRELRAEIAAHPKQRIHHPFLAAVEAGTASRAHVQEWARQCYPFHASIPRIAMLRYLACTDPEIAARMFGVLEEETQGMATGSAGHITLFRDFGAALGLSREELDNVSMSPGTAALVYYVELCIHTQPWFIVMTAQMAGEGTAPAAMARLVRAFKANYGLTAEDVRFFSVHVDADQDHGSLAEDIAERYLCSPELQAQARATALRRLELQYDAWTIDGFQQAT